MSYPNSILKLSALPVLAAFVLLGCTSEPAPPPTDVELVKAGNIEELKKRIDNDPQFDPNATGDRNVSLLGWAILRGHMDIFQLLLDEGAEFKEQGESGRTMLHDAAVMGEVEAVRKLVEAGASVDVKDDRGHTPFLEACYNQQLDTAILLIKLGADPDVKDNDGQSWERLGRLPVFVDDLNAFLEEYESGTKTASPTIVPGR